MEAHSNHCCVTLHAVQGVTLHTVQGVTLHGVQGAAHTNANMASNVDQNQFTPWHAMTWKHKRWHDMKCMTTQHSMHHKQQHIDGKGLDGGFE